MVLAVACWCGLFAAGPPSYPRSAGAAYAERGNPAASVPAWCRGEALVWAVRAGAGPELIGRAFGPPLMSLQFREGPVEWWYPDLGVTACFSPGLFRPAIQFERIRGGIQ